MWSDLRLAVRMLLKRPGTTGIAVLALALGIGLTTTMFSIVEGAFLRGLPFDRAEDIMHVGSRQLTDAAGQAGASTLHDLADWRARQHVFEELAAFSTLQVTLSGDDGAPSRHQAAAFTPNLLRSLRVTPAAGRAFTEADAQPGAPKVLIISDVVWRNQFRGDPAVVGRVVRLDGQPASIVGVMPARFGFPETERVWVPLQTSLPARRGEGNRVEVVGRLAGGVSVETAGIEMTGIAAQLARENPENKDRTADVQGYMDRFFGGRAVRALTTMLVAVVGVFLIACVNVTNLQLARAAERMREVAVRTALGASRFRIVRQMLIEGLVLSSIGAIAGLAITYVGTIVFMRAIVDTEPPFWIDVRIDATVLAAATGLTMLAALASTLVPALRVSKQPLNNVLKDENRGTTGLRIGRLSRGLVIVEMMFSCGLLVVSGLIGKSILALGTIDFPFEVDRTFVSRVSIDVRIHPDDATVAPLTEQLRERLAGVPGVRAVALAGDVPGGGSRMALEIEGRPAPAGTAAPIVRRLRIAPEVIEVIGLPIRQGRGFTAADRSGAELVAIVSEDLANRFFPSISPVGRRIRLGTDGKRPWLTIVGVVPKVAVMLQATQVPETVLVPMAQAATPPRDLVVLASTAGDPNALTPLVRQAVVAFDHDMPLVDPGSLRDAYNRDTWPYHVFGGLFMTFGAGALVLAAAGLYGVMAFSVRRRTSEIGVRMALGADRRRILVMVVRQGLVQVAIGVAVGLGLGRLLAGRLSILFFSVAPFDATVFAGTVAVLAGAGALACAVPALRAASIDPMQALRQD